MGVHATAKVEVVVEISILQGWGGGCQLDQVYKRSVDNAMDVLRLVLSGRPDIKIVKTSVIETLIRKQPD